MLEVGTIAELGAEKSRAAARPAAPSFSETLWDFSWNKYLPILIAPSIQLRQADVRELVDFSQRHFLSIYGEEALSSAWMWNQFHPARAKFYEAVSDAFVFENESNAIGMVACHATDWSSYYLRNISILPQYQNQKLYQLFLDLLIGVLARTAVERIEVDVAAINSRAVYVLSKKGFVCTGQLLSERWGHLSRYTYLLKAESRKFFAKQFFVQKEERSPL